MQHNFQMEENNTDIFLLIRGLSSSEKSYYKKMSKRHANQNGALHLKLFQLIDEFDLRDENELCEKLKIENKIQFSGLKTYLQKDILDSLVFQKRNKTVDTQLYFIHDQVRALQEKNLLFLAQKLCRKGIALATQFEKYHFLVLLLHQQSRVLEYKNYKQYKSTTDNVFSSLTSAIVLQQALAANRYLYEKTRNLTYRSWLPITDEELAEIRNTKTALCSSDPSNNGQPVISLYYLNALALCQYMLHENNPCTLTCQRIFNLWNTSPRLISEYPFLFLSSINTSCYNGFVSADILHVRENMTAYRQMVKGYLKNDSYCKYFEVLDFNTDLKIYLKNGQFVLLKTLINNKSKLIFSYSAKILAPAERLSILSSVCIAYFVLQKWDDAEGLMILIKELNRSINRHDILYFSLLFHLVILYEQEEWYRLDSALEAAYHFLYSRKILRPFERELLLFFRHLTVKGSKRNANKLIKYFLNRLDNYKDDPDKNLYFLYFNYYGWLESKIMKIRYMDYISSRLKHLQSED